MTRLKSCKAVGGSRRQKLLLMWKVAGHCGQTSMTLD